MFTNEAIAGKENLWDTKEGVMVPLIILFKYSKESLFLVYLNTKSSYFVIHFITNNILENIIILLP